MSLVELYVILVQASIDAIVCGEKTEFGRVNSYNNDSTNGKQIYGSTRRNPGRCTNQVGKFIFLVNFVVIDIEEDKQVPLLLGRQFLATGVALIDVKKGELTLRVGIEEVHFNINQSLKQPDF